MKLVIEADEFDRSFHWLRPWMSVITSTDPDHLDIYGTKEAYLESFRHYTELIHSIKTQGTFDEYTEAKEVCGKKSKKILSVLSLVIATLLLCGAGAVYYLGGDNLKNMFFKEGGKSGKRDTL